MLSEIVGPVFLYAFLASVDVCATCFGGMATHREDVRFAMDDTGRARKRLPKIR